MLRATELDSKQFVKFTKQSWLNQDYSFTGSTSFKDSYKSIFTKYYDVYDYSVCLKMLAAGMLHNMNYSSEFFENIKKNPHDKDVFINYETFDSVKTLLDSVNSNTLHYNILFSILDPDVSLVSPIDNQIVSPHYTYFASLSLLRIFNISNWNTCGIRDFTKDTLKSLDYYKNDNFIGFNCRYKISGKHGVFPQLRNIRALKLLDLYSMPELIALNGKAVQSAAVYIFFNFTYFSSEQTIDDCYMIIDREGYILEIDELTSENISKLQQFEPDIIDILLRKNKNPVLDTYSNTTFYGKRTIVINLHQLTVTPGFININLHGVENQFFEMCPNLETIRKITRRAFHYGITSWQFNNKNMANTIADLWLAWMYKFHYKHPDICLGVVADDPEGRYPLVQNKWQSSVSRNLPQETRYYNQFNKFIRANLLINQYSSLLTLALCNYPVKIGDLPTDFLKEKGSSDIKYANEHLYMVGQFTPQKFRQYCKKYYYDYVYGSTGNNSNMGRYIDIYNANSRYDRTYSSYEQYKDLAAFLIHTSTSSFCKVEDYINFDLEFLQNNNRERIPFTIQTKKIGENTVNLVKTLIKEDFFLHDKLINTRFYHDCFAPPENHRVIQSHNTSLIDNYLLHIANMRYNLLPASTSIDNFDQYLQDMRLDNNTFFYIDKVKSELKDKSQVEKQLKKSVKSILRENFDNIAIKEIEKYQGKNNYPVKSLSYFEVNCKRNIYNYLQVKNMEVNIDQKSDKHPVPKIYRTISQLSKLNHQNELTRSFNIYADCSIVNQQLNTCFTDKAVALFNFKPKQLLQYNFTVHHDPKAVVIRSHEYDQGYEFNKLSLSVLPQVIITFEHVGREFNDKSYEKIYTQQQHRLLTKYTHLQAAHELQSNYKGGQDIIHNEALKQDILNAPSPDKYHFYDSLNDIFGANYLANRFNIDMDAQDKATSNPYEFMRRLFEKEGEEGARNAIKYFTSNPAKLLRRSNSLGSLKEGALANFLVWNPDFSSLASTWVNGICVNRNKFLDKLSNKVIDDILEKFELLVDRKTKVKVPSTINAGVIMQRATEKILKELYHADEIDEVRDNEELMLAIYMALIVAIEQ
ncbi:amidohydrolase family protein, partial [Psittacicella hinzii]